MNRICLAFFVLLSLLMPSVVGMGTMVINEVELGPPGDANEWVELYNAGDDAVNIGLWTISIVEGSWTGIIKVPRETNVSAGEYYVAEGDERWIHGTNGTVILRAESWDVVDKTHHLADDGGNDFTWCRCPNGVDTDEKGDWVFTKSTRNAENMRHGTQVA